jgi:hypothetical protein
LRTTGLHLTYWNWNGAQFNRWRCVRGDSDRLINVSCCQLPQRISQSFITQAFTSGGGHGTRTRNPLRGT